MVHNLTVVLKQGLLKAEFYGDLETSVGRNDFVSDQFTKIINSR